MAGEVDGHSDLDDLLCHVNDPVFYILDQWFSNFNDIKSVHFEGWGDSSVVERLPSMYKTLGFIPNTASKECISVKFCLQKF
jgi:hypothetical protein